MLPSKKNAAKKLFADFGLFWPFFNQKTAKKTAKKRKLAKSKPLNESFRNLICRCLPTNKMLQFFFVDFGLSWQKTAKIDQKQRKLGKSNPYGEIFGNLLLDASQQKKMVQKKHISILAFLGFFLAKKQRKLTKNEENWQNPKRLIKFSEI